MLEFTDGDVLDEELREYVPRPPSEEINRIRGRIAYERTEIVNHDTPAASGSENGAVIRIDWSRIGGSFWTLTGYWRGSLVSTQSTSQTTLLDLMNRTYHLSLNYSNPNSKWVAGVGRMYLPWASSLDTIDGGYIGRKVSEHAVAGFFGGSTPDPTSWSYNPNRRIAGSFVSFDQGSYDAVHSMTTLGMGVSTLGWTVDRPFVFAENTISYKQFFSVYDAFKFDRPRTIPPVTAVSAGLGQAFVSMRMQASRRVGFDVNYNYFRDVPTYDPLLLGTGLLDKYLFQGLSAGVRVEGPRHLSFYTEIGRSNSSRDTTSSWNKMFGVTLGQLWHTGLRLDARYSRFNSAFAQGSYRSFSVSRSIGEAMRLELQAGKQSFNSSLTRDNGTNFLNSMLELNLGSKYFLDNGFTFQHGSVQSYRQFYLTFGYRFDNRDRRKAEMKP